MSDKTWCTEHNAHLMNCFYEHHKPIDPQLLKLRMPCGHLCNRPTKTVEVVVCDGGETTWHLKLESFNVWNAVKVK